PRVHDLGHVQPDAGELDHGLGARGVFIGGRPDAGHELIHDTPFQEGAHPAELLVDVVVQLVVDHVPIELAVRPLDEAIERHRHHQDDLSHRGPESYVRKNTDAKAASAAAACSASTCSASLGARGSHLMAKNATIGTWAAMRI